MILQQSKLRVCYAVVRFGTSRTFHEMTKTAGAVIPAAWAVVKTSEYFLFHKTGYYKFRDTVSACGLHRNSEIGIVVHT